MTQPAVKSKKRKFGRKPLEDRSMIKIQLCFWIPQAYVDKLGGMDEARTFCIDAMQKAKPITKNKN